LPMPMHASIHPRFVSAVERWAPVRRPAKWGLEKEHMHPKWISKPVCPPHRTHRITSTYRTYTTARKHFSSLLYVVAYVAYVAYRTVACREPGPIVLIFRYVSRRIRYVIIIRRLYYRYIILRGRSVLRDTLTVQKAESW
jgi:hypothetical protein